MRRLRKDWELSSRFDSLDWERRDAFPYWLALELIQDHVPQGGMVCDPYVGGGTTILAAQALGVQYVACDVDPARAALVRPQLKWPSALQVSDASDFVESNLPPLDLILTSPPFAGIREPSFNSDSHAPSLTQVADTIVRLSSKLRPNGGAIVEMVDVAMANGRSSQAEFCCALMSALQFVQSIALCDLSDDPIAQTTNRTNLLIFEKRPLMTT